MLAILVFVPAAEPASACHRFSHWAYPWSQRCSAAATHAIRHAPAEPKDWYVEIVLTPKVIDDISHGIGIEKIKQLNPALHEEKP